MGRGRETEDIITAFVKRPHLVILGAGATMATIPNGDKNGMKSSVMNDFMQNLGLENILDGVALKTKSSNIEDIYSEIFEREDCLEIREQLDNIISNYFKQLEIPDNPTIYDYLILSLRKKDCIASFNWDDLLIQAYLRIRKITEDLPQIIFLHGNVGAGICEKCERYGVLKYGCPQCGEQYAVIPLLYPIKHKDYTSNIFIKDQWEVLKDFISRAALVTVFGYSAPKSDIEAISILKENFIKFGKSLRILDLVEIIERADKDENEIYESWGYFFDNVHGHSDIHSSFYDSFLAEFPRRSVEGYAKRNIGGWWGRSSISITENIDAFSELKQIINPLIIDEQAGKYEVV